MTKSIKLLCVALPQELEIRLPYGYTVVYTGVGKVQAAYHLQRAIVDAYARGYTDITVTNYGTAGGLNPLVTGLVEIGRFVQRDMIAEPLTTRGTIPFSNPPVSSIITSSPVSQVCCGTGDSFVTETDLFYVSSDIDCVDMEGWALAYIAEQYHLPFRSFKYISDNADSDAADSWTANCGTGAELILNKLKELDLTE